MQPADESWYLKHKERKGHKAKLGTLNYTIGGAIALMHTLANLTMQHPTLDAQGFDIMIIIGLILWSCSLQIFVV